jgi:hypothetical protein
MTSHHARLYGLALALVVFFLGWAIVAAHPWATTTSDPRLRALAVREAHLRQEARVVGRVVAARWAHYRVQLKLRRAQIAGVSASNAAAQQSAATGPVQVVNLPAHVVTRTS